MIYQGTANLKRVFIKVVKTDTICDKWWHVSWSKVWQHGQCNHIVFPKLSFANSLGLHEMCPGVGGELSEEIFNFCSFFSFLLSFLPSLLQYKHIKKWSPCWRVMQHSVGARHDLKIYVCDTGAWKVRWKNWMKTCLHGSVQLGSAICIVATFVSVITLFLPSVKWKYLKHRTRLGIVVAKPCISNKWCDTIIYNSCFTYRPIQNRNRTVNVWTLVL